MQNLSLNQLIRRYDYHRPLIFNGVLWFLGYLILLFIFSKGSTPVLIDYVFTGCYTILLAIPVISNFYLLIPKLLRKERYFYYILALLIHWVVCSLVAIYGIEPLLNLLFPNLYFISYPRGMDHFSIYGITLLVTTLIKLAEEWFYFNKNQNKILQLEKNQVQGQLSALRAQINPHFLFNSLNVIYALALEKNEAVTKSILQLSDILRYVIYDSNIEKVPLDQELKLIKDYIDFQKYRHHLDEPIALNTDIESLDFRIYPMLILPFIENSFKHGLLKSQSGQPAIKIKLTQKSNWFEFYIENAFLEKAPLASMEPSGIGIENIKNNLELVYPNNHELRITSYNHIFTVTLKIID